MSARWGPLAARARGLATHLLGRDRLEELARLPALALLAEALAPRWRTLSVELANDPTQLDQGIRRAAAVELRGLARWCDAPARVLLFEEEDRRNLRYLLRGVGTMAPTEARLAGLLPTPTLPEARLRELARQATVGQIAALLATWGIPYGSALLAASWHEPPDLFALELVLSRAHLDRAAQAARSVGRPAVEEVRFLVDLENFWTALLVASKRVEREPAELFLDGGAYLARDSFLHAAAAADPHEGALRLARALIRTPPGDVLSAAGGDWQRVEDAALAVRVRRARRRSRTHPLEFGVALAFVLRLRAEVRDLARIIWAVAFDTPRAGLVQSLVTV